MVTLTPTMLYVLNFGEHKGKKLCDVPEDYLYWMGLKEKEFQLKFGGRDWEALARAEYERRRTGGELIEVKGVFGIIEETPKKGNRSKKVDSVSKGVIDESSLICLKKFIQRLNKKEGLYSWLVSLGEEALNYGQHVDVGVILHTNSKVQQLTIVKSYVGLTFKFVESNMTGWILSDIQESKEDV